MAPKVDAAPPAPTSLAGSERQGFAPGTCGRVLRGGGARWASDEFPKKGERGRRANKVSAERARNLPEEGERAGCAIEFPEEGEHAERA